MSVAVGDRVVFTAIDTGNPITWVTKDGELLHVAVKKEECKEKTTKAKTCPAKSWVVSERWVDGKVQAIKGEEELGTKVSYLIGNDSSKHRSGLSTYRYVSLGEVWPGVEVKLKATQKTVERLFYIQPGADPSKIQVQLDGAKGLKLSKDGEIIIQAGLGDLKLSKPIAWQEKDGKELPVEVSYKLIDKNRYSFVVAKADPSLPIVIDPILQSTYLGGNDYDLAFALAIPSTGDVYVAGWTLSTNFPKTNGGAQANYGGGDDDAFVAKLNSNLTQIIQSTYLGGSGLDWINVLAIHPTTGDVYVAGATTSSTNFPKTNGGAQANYGGGNDDAFVARLSADLAATASSCTLSINPTPTNGKVTSSPAGINCGSGGACSASFTSASTVVLTATPSTGYTFAGWGGDCSGCGTSNTCNMNMTANKTCSANFTASGGSGSGSGSGSGGGSGSGSGSGGGSGSGSSGGSGSSSGSSGGGGCSMTGPASMAGWWNILTWLLVPTYVFARRIRRMK